MMVSFRLYWTLWILSCFGQYLGQDLQIPEPPNKTEGDSVVFAPDNPPPSTSTLITQWFFATTPIITVASGVTTVTPAYEGRVSFDSNTLALTLQNLRLNDSGIYRLTVQTSAGAALTGETSLQVEKLSVRLIGTERPLIEGESSANITSEGNGIITSVQWMKDNSPLSPSNSIIFSPDNRSVSISPVQRSDSGEYQCTYTNPVTSGTAKLRLTINYGPEDVSIKGPDVVDLGVHVSLSCSANSEPSASFRWMFNGTDTNVTTNTFTIDETDVTHSGDYDCTAWNSVTNRNASQRHVLLVKASCTISSQHIYPISMSEGLYINTVDSPMFLNSFSASLHHPVSSHSPGYFPKPEIWGEYSGFGPNTLLGALSSDNTPNTHTVTHTIYYLIILGGGGGLTTGAIVGIVIGVLVAVSGICGLIVYLIKTKKIPEIKQQQKEQASGATQNTQEHHYQEPLDFQMTSGDGAILGNERNIYENRCETDDYVNVKHGFSNRPRAPAPPPGIKPSSCAPLRK